MAGDPYALLGVPRDVGAAELQRSYERALNDAHRAGALRLAQDLVQAHDTLRDARRRRLFDEHARLVSAPRLPPQTAYYARQRPGAPWRAPTRSMLDDGTPGPAQSCPAAPGPSARRRPRLGLASLLAVLVLGIGVGMTLAHHTAAPASGTVAPARVGP